MQVTPTSTNLILSRGSGSVDAVNASTNSPVAKSPGAKAPGEHSPQDVETAKAKRQMLAAQREIAELASRDQEVRAHEQAHAAVGGRYAGSPNFSFQRGPNGASYAVSGHVDVDVSKIAGDPAATLQKMMVVQRAAMAPQTPSPQDRIVAAKAAQQAAGARVELAELRIEARPNGELDRHMKAAETSREGIVGGLLDVTV